VQFKLHNNRRIYYLTNLMEYLIIIQLYIIDVMLSAYRRNARLVNSVTNLLQTITDYIANSARARA